MKNPWEEIPLSDYENHMKLDSVHQLQTMNEMMRGQHNWRRCQLRLFEKGRTQKLINPGTRRIVLHDKSYWNAFGISDINEFAFSFAKEDAFQDIACLHPVDVI